MRTTSDDLETNWVSLKDQDEAPPFEANVISSTVYKDEQHHIHVPLIDLDIEHFYVKSTNPGHAHLYINKQLTHEQYGKLLRSLFECGIISEGIVKQFERDGCTSLRMPGIRKE